MLHFSLDLTNNVEILKLSAHLYHILVPSTFLSKQSMRHYAIISICSDVAIRYESHSYHKKGVKSHGAMYHV